MMEATFHGTREQLLTILHALPAVLSGDVTDTHNVTEGLRTRLVNAFLKKAHEAAVAKGRGEPGDDGVTWRPLAKSTIRRRRRKQYRNEVDTILEEQGQLLDALLPGKEDKAGTQELHHTPDSVVVPVTAETAKGFDKARHHDGVGRAVSRRLWHREGHMTDPWKEALLSAFAEGLPSVIAAMLKG